MFIRKRLPDLFSGKPLVITGRYTAAANGNDPAARQTGQAKKVEREIPVSFTAELSRRKRAAQLLGAAQD